MKSINIKPTNLLPLVELNAEKGVFKMNGRSIPENALEFFGPIVKWIDAYAQNPNKHTVMVFFLEYFNTSTSKYILEICKKLETINNKEGYNAAIEWLYEEDDTDIKDAGEDYMAILTMPFYLKKVNNDGHIIESALAQDNKKNQLTMPVTEPEGSLREQLEEKELELTVVTSISDRLQNKLNQANEKLTDQASEITRINNELQGKNNQLQQTIDDLTKAKAGRRATTIVLIILVGLYILAELGETYLEKKLGETFNFYWIFVFKIGLALFLKPIEQLTEKYIIRRQASRTAKSVSKAGV